MDPAGKEDPLDPLDRQEKKVIWVHLEQLELLELGALMEILDLRDPKGNPAHLDRLDPPVHLSLLSMTFSVQTSNPMANQSLRPPRLPRQSSMRMRQSPIKVLKWRRLTARFICLSRTWEVS